MNASKAKPFKMALAVVGLMVIGAGVAWLLDARNERKQTVLSSGGSDVPKLEPLPSLKKFTEPAPPIPPLEPQPAAAPPPVPPVVKFVPPSVSQTPPPPSPTRPPTKPKEPARDPLARAALSLVGKDAAAEAIWLAAINNPDLPANERKDLIEDLNEDGFPNPKRPTADDLPLIRSRILIIERLAPDAMDEVNAAAFAEAYKDLVKLAVRLTPP